MSDLKHSTIIGATPGETVPKRIRWIIAPSGRAVECKLQGEESTGKFEPSRKGLDYGGLA
jgi:hypothetical protein